MPTLTNNFDSNLSYGSEERTLAYSDVSFIEVRNIMIPVNFINIFKASLLDHRSCSSWTFLSWLEQKSNELIGWDFVTIVVKNLGSSQNGYHMTVMTAHVSVVSCCFIFQIMVQLRHREPIHISSYSDGGNLAIFVFLRASASDVDGDSSSSASFNFVIFEPKGFESICQCLLGLEFFETMFRMSVKLLPEFHERLMIHIICFTFCGFIEHLSMLYVEILEIRL
tara:strand:+ start:348 stop:1019 length:672 start_codon:yes stop_codon:yes gene_type:complete